MLNIFISQPPNKPKKQKTTTEKPYSEKQTEKRETFWQRLKREPIVLCTFLLVIATAFLAIASFIQVTLLYRAEHIAITTANAAKESAEVAREALTSTQRAFVSFKEMEVRKIVRDNKVVSWRFGVNIENSGNTPAINMDSRARSKTSDNPSPPSLNDFKNLEKEHSIPKSLGPHASVGVGEIVIIPIDDVIKIYNHIKHLYIFGTITYRDIIEKTPIHRERFSFEVARIATDPTDIKHKIEVILVAHPTYEDVSQR
jgi:hypothetical protein